MTWFVTTLAVVLIVITTAAVLGRVDGSLAEPTSSLAHEPLPEGPLTAADLDELRFDTGLRGYRMAQVDRVVDRLRLEITTLEEEVARLRAAEGEDDPAAPSDGPARDGPARDDPAGLEPPNYARPAARQGAQQEETA